MLVLSLIKEIEIIGEAASRVSPELRQTLPSIPWADIVGMRNRLIHAYFDILWDTVSSALDPLILQLEAALESAK